MKVMLIMFVNTLYFVILKLMNGQGEKYGNFVVSIAKKLFNSSLEAPATEQLMIEPHYLSVFTDSIMEWKNGENEGEDENKGKDVIIEMKNSESGERGESGSKLRGIPLTDIDLESMIKLSKIPSGIRLTLLTKNL